VIYSIDYCDASRSCGGLVSASAVSKARCANERRACATCYQLDRKAFARSVFQEPAGIDAQPYMIVYHTRQYRRRSYRPDR